ncbi:MAG: hypothetical protein NC124_16655 [Clostridium sp.]|nr:hypothetical protein [Clostridium sp.]
MDRKEKTDREEKRNAIFGKLFIGFMAAAAVLTFFSKSLYNYRLPVVTVTSPIQGELDFSVEGSAELSYAECTPCYAEVVGRIEEILVGNGDKVKKGQCLMKIASVESDQVEEVRAAEDGIITSIGVEKGMYVSYMLNTVLYEEAKISGDWNAVMFISDEEAENVETGSRAAIKLPGKNMSFDGEVVDVVSYAGTDFTGKQAVIRFHAEDTSIAGEQADITIKKDGTLCDTLIPAAALQQDEKGYYVLTLQEDNGVLGAGYKAARMAVDRMDADKLYCAVQGLPEGVSVIVEATSEIFDGDHVYYEGE